MKHTNSKFFIMFLAGIFFSAITVFAATVTVNTDFTEDAVQFLQKLILTNADGTTTGVVLDGINKQILSDTICSTDGSNCKNIIDLFTGVDTDTQLNTGQVNIMETDPIFLTHSGEFLREELWNAGTNNNISYISGNVGIGATPTSAKLSVNGTGEFGYIGTEGGASFGGDISVDGDILMPASSKGTEKSIKVGYGTTCTSTGTDLRIQGGNGSNGRDPATSVEVSTAQSCAASDIANGGDIILNGGKKFGTTGSYDGNVILADTYGKVGIGTNNPHAKLEVKGTVAFSRGTISLNTGDTLIPTASYISISCSSSLGCTNSISDGNADGQILIITSFNQGNTNNFKDTDLNLAIAGDLYMDRYDTLQLIRDKNRTKWIEISRSNPYD